MSASDRHAKVSGHYAQQDLAARILNALRQAGKNLDALTIDDLAPVDQFHSRGKQSTMELAQRAGISAGQAILDVGGGLGGPARTLATMFGCNVTVVDLTEEYCRVGELLTARIGLSDRVRHLHGNASRLPFPDASFDLVWTQHSTMNIEHKPGIYAEFRRVLRHLGRYALQEIMQGENTPIHFPVPWARDPAISFLQPAATTRRLIEAAGFAASEWIDETLRARDWFEQRVQAASELPPLGIHLLLGDDIVAMAKNQLRNLNESRIAIIQGVFQII
ncbi:MAG: methyltransferase domain-containing protein [Pseudomonadota bacterium]|nr:methyltransferase domain-containing protein [Pseudomonadota bacterium]